MSDVSLEMDRFRQRVILNAVVTFVIIAILSVVGYNLFIRLDTLESKCGMVAINNVIKYTRDFVGVADMDLKWALDVNDASHVEYNKKLGMILIQLTILSDLSRFGDLMFELSCRQIEVDKGLWTRWIDKIQSMDEIIEKQTDFCETRMLFEKLIIRAKVWHLIDDDRLFLKSMVKLYREPSEGGIRQYIMNNPKIANNYIRISKFLELNALIRPDEVLLGMFLSLDKAVGS